MGEENTFVGSKFFFCRTEDIGTEKEKWHKAELKSIDSIKVREATEVPNSK